MKKINPILSIMFSVMALVSGCTHVRPSPSQAVEQACNEIVSKLSKGLAPNAPYRLAVNVFEDANGTAKTVQRALMEHLKGELSDSGHFVVVEDTTMNAVLREAAVQDKLKGVIDQQTLLDLEHRLVGVNALLLGVIIDYGSEWGIMCRLIPLHQGTIGGHASSKISKSGFVDATIRENPIVKSPSSVPPSRWSSNPGSPIYAPPARNYNPSPVVVPQAPSAESLGGLIPR